MLVTVPLVANHAACGSRIFVILVRDVVHRGKAAAVAPDGEDIFLGRTKQAAELDELVDGVGVVELGGDGLGVHTEHIHALLVQAVKVGLAVQFEPHHIAVVGHLTAGVPAVLVEDSHAHFGRVGQVGPDRLPEAFLNDVIHLAAAVAIDEDGIACLKAGHRQQFPLAPLVELGGLGSIGLVEGHGVAALVVYRQLTIHGLIRPVPRAVVHHRDQFAVLGRLGEWLVLHGDRLLARQEVRVAHARAVGIEHPHVPRLSVAPNGKSLAREVAYPCAH